MESHLELVAVQHPDPRVHRVGFELTDRYVEQCWGAILGPSSTALLRRVPQLWEHEEPARLPVPELAGSLGLGTSTSERGRFGRAIQRLEHFRFVTWLDRDGSLGVFTEVPPLGSHQLARVSAWTQRAHERLLGEHLDGLTAGSTPTRETRAITARLDRLQQHASRPIDQRSALGR